VLTDHAIDMEFGEKLHPPIEMIIWPCKPTLQLFLICNTYVFKYKVCILQLRTSTSYKLL
jgi:hypothetical protein